MKLRTLFLLGMFWVALVAFEATLMDAALWGGYAPWWGPLVVGCGASVVNIRVYAHWRWHRRLKQFRHEQEVAQAGLVAAMMRDAVSEPELERLAAAAPATMTLPISSAVVRERAAVARWN